MRGINIMTTLIIAEKPSVAASIASALGANKRQDGYFEGNGYLISFAFGHLYTLANTRDYNPDMTGWKLDDYPFIPDQFRYKPIEDTGVKKQIKIIKELVTRADLIVNACDGDREGELIFAELKSDLRIDKPTTFKPVKRLWITSHTPKDIAKGMDTLREDTLNLERAGYCRQQIDWIIGINLTVVFTLKAGGEITLKVGRVMLPTLKLIFDREAEIANFVSVPFYTLKCEFKTNSETYTGLYQDQEGNVRFSNSGPLQAILEAIKGKFGIITHKESKQSNQNAPRLFNLTDLQGHITSKFKGFTSDKVLEVMQSLYEKKYLTYPRTASRYLDDSQVKDAEESLQAVLSLPELGLKNKTDVAFHSDKRVFDSSKVDSHPAIIPTYIIPDISNLTDDEQIVYLEVAKRFVAQFLPAAVYDTLEVITNVEGHEFITKGKVLVVEGWRQLYLSQADPDGDSESDEKEQDNEQPVTAKNLKQGDQVATGDSELKDGKTKPPAHYTEKTLLSAMENCGKQVEDESELLKGYTIGTPATRGDTLKKLIECNYIQTKGKNLLITDLGAKVVVYFPVKMLLKTTFTGQIEKTLKDIENGQYDSKEFMNKMTAYITKSILDMKSKEIPAIRKPVNILGKCPECGKNVIETSKAYSCEGTRDKQCKFTLWKDDKFFALFKKKLTETLAKELITKRQATVKGLKSTKKEGVKFDAIIHLKKHPETGYWNYEMEFPAKKSRGKTSPTHKKF
jgi:DNA topoisomerase-3